MPKFKHTPKRKRKAENSRLSLFASTIWLKKLLKPESSLIKHLLEESFKIAQVDGAGRRWSKTNYLGGYTSYGSLDQVHQLSPYFSDLEKKIRREVIRFAKVLEYDVGSPHSIYLQNIWINIMPPGVVHTSHIHPGSTISGTVYLATPPGSSALKFEDPRLGMMMHSPPRRRSKSGSHHGFYKHQPTAGEIVLFESWMRHEVEANPSNEKRVSVSFNYDWTTCS